jgi:cyclic pyranopterin phosphate synthase
MRISITDRCNLRCKYCQPDGVEQLPHSDILSYEEILRVCKIAATLGITKFKVTGGEPFARKGAADFIRCLKDTDGVNQVTLTTNALLMPDVLPSLIESKIGGINISLNAVERSLYKSITGFDGAKTALNALRFCAASGIKAKINCVLLNKNTSQIVPLVNLARDMAVDVRFIELMPLGYGSALAGINCDDALGMIRRAFPDLDRCGEKRGNGPAVYYKSRELKGRIGFIGANSHKFCASCNRIRMTATGYIKPCLCYENGTDLRMLLRCGASDKKIKDAIQKAILAKPAAHCFENTENVTERKKMSEIGG